MTRSECEDFCRFLVKKRLINSAVVPSIIRDMPGYHVVAGARRILSHLASTRQIAETTATHDQLVDEWTRSVNETNAGQPAARVEKTELVSSPRPSARQPQVAALPVKAASPSADLPEQIGPFLIKRKLGQGGMGAVFLGEHKDMGFLAAVKIITAHPGDLDAVARFKREVQITITVRHPNIIHTFGADLDHNPRYIALEYIEGDKLDKAVHDLPPGQLAQQLRLCVEKVRDASRGVQAWHTQGIIHRDLKPDNILMDTSGRVVVLDPGMARPIDNSSLTMDGEIVGTPMYMAPEQMNRLPEDKYTPAVDIYSLGKILFYLLTKTHVHSATNLISLMNLVLTNPIPDHVVPSLQSVMSAERYERLGPVILKCLAAKPGDRYQSGAELAEALDDFLVWDRNSEQTTRENEQRELRRRKEQVRKFIVAGIVGLVLLVFSLLASIGFAMARNAERATAREAQARAQAETRRAEAEAEAAQTSEASRVAESRKAEVARKLVVAQTFMNGADWQNAKRELREILFVDETSYAARWLLAEASYNSFDPDYLVQYRWLADNASDPAEKARAQFWVVFAGLDQGGITFEEASELIAEIEPGLYRDLAELYFAGHEASRFTGLANIARRDRNEAQARRHEQTSREWAGKGRALIGRLDPNHWLVAFVHGFMFREDVAVARERLTYALSHNPNLAMAYYWRAALVHEDTQHPQPIGAVHDAERLHVLMPGWTRGEMIRGSSYLAMAQYWERESGLTQDPQERERLIDESVRWADKAVEVPASSQTWGSADVNEKHADSIEGHWAYFLYHKCRILKAAGRNTAAEQVRQQALAAIERLGNVRRRRGSLAPQMENIYRLVPTELEKLR